jgi:hypothetical protein
MPAAAIAATGGGAELAIDEGTGNDVEAGGGGAGDDGIGADEDGGAAAGAAKMSPSSFQPEPCHDTPVDPGVGAAGGGGGGGDWGAAVG